MARAIVHTSIVASVVLALAATVVACDDDEAGEPSAEQTSDSGAPSPDGGRVEPTPTSDAGLDGAVATPDDSGAQVDADAGPTISSAVGVTGYVRLFNDAVFADFYEDDTIVRASNAPECVGHVRSQSKPTSPAGTLTVGGAVIGADGGPSGPLTIEPDPEGGGSYAFFDAIFPTDDALQVSVEGNGTESFPAMPVQALRPPPAAIVPVTAPASSGSAVVVASTQPLAIAWTPPAAAQADGRMVVEFAGIDGATTSKIASLFCSFPLSSGSASIPANLLADLKARVGGGAKGYLKIYAGGAKEFTAGGASYVLVTSRGDAVGLDAFDTELQ